MTQTHYDVEDMPRNDADTQVELYRQANEVVADGLKHAHDLFKKAEAYLHELFVEAENASNGHLMSRINDTYEAVQKMAALMGQQGAALNGANSAIDAITVQRDAVLGELDDLQSAIREYDFSHEGLVDFVDELREMEMDYYADSGYDIFNEDLNESVRQTIDKLFPDAEFTSANYMIAFELIMIIDGHKTPSEAQQAALLSLLKTLDIGSDL